MGFCPVVLMTLSPKLFLQLLKSLPVGVGQIYGCDNLWAGSIFLCAILLSSPIMCLHATIGSLLGIAAGKDKTPCQALSTSSTPGVVSGIFCPPDLSWGLHFQGTNRILRYFRHPQTPSGAPCLCPQLWLLLSYLTALSLSAPFEDIYFGSWGLNSSLACIAIGGMFMALTWQTHLLALACGEYPVHLKEGCLWLWDQNPEQRVKKDCMRS